MPYSQPESLRVFESAEGAKVFKSTEDAEARGLDEPELRVVEKALPKLPHAMVPHMGCPSNKSMYLHYAPCSCAFMRRVRVCAHL